MNFYPPPSARTQPMHPLYLETPGRTGSMSHYAPPPPYASSYYTRAHPYLSGDAYNGVSRWRKDVHAAVAFNFDHWAVMLPTLTAPVDPATIAPFLPQLQFSPSPSDSSSSLDTPLASPISVARNNVHVVCDVPLVAPKPLPYHSPTFLQFDLPDDDEDLSYPPYTTRSSKRKRSEEPDEDTTVAKRRNSSAHSYSPPVSHLQTRHRSRSHRSAPSRQHCS